MGIFIEDLLNFGNLIDTEIEIRLSPDQFKSSYPYLDFYISDGILGIILKRRVFLFNKTYEIRLSDVNSRVRKDRENQKQWVFLKLLSKSGLEDLIKWEGFVVENEYLGIDITPAVIRTETYEKIPKQFRERMIITKCRLGKDYLSTFFKFEK